MRGSRLLLTHVVSRVRHVPSSHQVNRVLRELTDARHQHRNECDGQPNEPCAKPTHDYEAKARNLESKAVAVVGSTLCLRLNLSCSR